MVLNGADTAVREDTYEKGASFLKVAKTHR